MNNLFWRLSTHYQAAPLSDKAPPGGQHHGLMIHSRYSGRRDKKAEIQETDLPFITTRSHGASLGSQENHINPSKGAAPVTSAPHLPPSTALQHHSTGQGF